MNKFMQFMYGRRGLDFLSGFLIIFSFVLSLVLRFFPIGIFRLLAYIPLIFGVYRMFSKNLLQRQKENDAFTNFWFNIKSTFKKISTNFKNRQNYKYFKCPNCKQRLRAPRGRGKIQVRCQKCQHEFIKKV